MFCGFGDNLTYADCEKTGEGGICQLFTGRRDTTAAVPDVR